MPWQILSKDPGTRWSGFCPEKSPIVSIFELFDNVSRKKQKVNQNNRMLVNDFPVPYIEIF